MSDEKVRGAVEIGPFGPSGSPLHSRIDRDLGDVLNHLIHLGHDLAGAYEYALRHLDDLQLRRRLRALEGAHGRQLRELTEQVTALGQTPAHRGDLRALVEKGRVATARLKGDRAILSAMATNEQTIHDAYVQALGLPGLPEPVRRVLEAALADEAQHRAFYAKQLGRFVG